MMDEARLDRLIEAHFDRQLTPGERAELDAMLLSSAQARRRFLDLAEWHGMLREHALREGGGMLLPEDEAEPPRRFRPGRRWWMAAGMAACVALLLRMIPSQAPPEEGAGPPGAAIPGNEIALLEYAVGVEWQGDAHGTGSALSPGVLKFRKGTISLGFYSGARVVIEGPASLELLSADLMRLDSGKLSAKVPPPAEGFTVLSAGLRVVDRGTRFGVNVSEQAGCEVHVFDGEVELQGEVPASASRELFGGDAVSIRGGTATAMIADPASFADPLGIHQVAAQETESQWVRWKNASRSFRAAEGLEAYFDFEDFPASGTTLPNRAARADANSDGSIIGCERLAGRWASKSALGFAKTSDRVRFRLQGSSESVTLLTSVRVDSLPLDHNSLLCMSPGRLGELHWKIDRAGRLLAGLRAEESFTFESWERLESPPVLVSGDFGRWVRLALVIDGEKAEMRHYLNGRRVAAGPIRRRTPVQLGTANLGNLDGHASDTQPVRNFNGRMDEFALFTRVLSDAEIALAGQAESSTRPAVEER